MRQGMAVSSALTLEAPLLHYTREPLALGGGCHVHMLPRNKVCCIQSGSRRQQRIMRDRKLDLHALLLETMSFAIALQVTGSSVRAQWQ